MTNIKKKEKKSWKCRQENLALEARVYALLVLKKVAAIKIANSILHWIMYNVHEQSANDFSHTMLQKLNFHCELNVGKS